MSNGNTDSNESDGAEEPDDELTEYFEQFAEGNPFEDLWENLEREDKLKIQAWTIIEELQEQDAIPRSVAEGLSNYVSSEREPAELLVVLNWLQEKFLDGS